MISLATQCAEPIGYESAGLLPPSRLVEHTRQALHDVMVYALRGQRPSVPHVERRVGGRDLVKPSPVAEAIGEALRTHVVASAILDVLKRCECPEAEALRESIAWSYANQNAPAIAAIGSR